MNIKELIIQLVEYPADAEVVIVYDGGIHGDIDHCLEENDLPGMADPSLYEDKKVLKIRIY